jgi:hypothetical protein
MSAIGRKRTLGLSLNRCSLTSAIEKKADIQLTPRRVLGRQSSGPLISRIAVEIDSYPFNNACYE